MVVSLLPGLERNVIFPPLTLSSHVYSDASGSYGCGAFVASCGWFNVQWPASWLDVAIAQKELVLVVMAAAVWGHSGRDVMSVFTRTTWLLFLCWSIRLRSMS